MSSPPSPALRGIGLTRTYRRRAGVVEAVRDVSLTVHAGELVGIEGPSGSGKSTLLHLLAGLDVPDEGRVFVDGHALDALDDAQRTVFRRRRIGIILQSFDLLPTLDASDNVAVPAILDGTAPRAARSAARRLLDSVGLGHRSDHTPAELSGGERQRVCIARALVNEPDLILADEPTATLDTATGDEILELLRHLATARRAIVLATHDPRAAAHAHRTIRLVDGQVVWPERDLRAVD